MIPDPGAPSGTFAALERTQPTPALFSFGRGDEGADGFLRGAVIDGDPVFITADVLRLLDLNRSSVALLDDDEKGVHTLDTPGGRQEHSVITESGLYSLVLRSRKPEAKAIKRWITHDVLPAIRKTGTYSRYPAAPQHLPSKKELAQWVVEAEDRAERAETKVAELEPKAEFFDELMDAEGCYSFLACSKVIGWGRNVMLRELRRAGVLTGSNLPYQRYAHHFKVVPQTYTNGKTGETVATATTYVLPSGVEFIRKRLADNDALAVTR